MRYLFLLFILNLVLTACEPKHEKTSDPSNNKATNLYKKYRVKKMMQYAQDLAFIDADAKGRLMQEYHFDRNGRVIKILRYDKTGDICYMEDVDPEDSSPEPTSPHQAKQKDTITVKNFGPQGNIVDKIKYTYNDSGQRIAMIRKDNQGEVVEKTTYEYYPNGLIKKDVYWNMDIEKPEQIINYDYKYY